MNVSLARITILISGRGSNMAALIDAARDGRIAGAVTHVISNMSVLYVARLHFLPFGFGFFKTIGSEFNFFFNLVY